MICTAAAAASDNPPLSPVGLLLARHDSTGATRYEQPMLCRALVDSTVPNHFFLPRLSTLLAGRRESGTYYGLLHGAKVSGSGATRPFCNGMTCCSCTSGCGTERWRRWSRSGGALTSAAYRRI